MRKRNYGYAIFSVLIVLVASFGIYQYTCAKQYQRMVNNQYHRSFSDLLDYVGNIELELKKGKAVTDSSQMSALSADIWKKAAFAQENLGQLPISDLELENTAKFLSQVGDYTYSLSKKMMDGESITLEEKQTMKELGDYATALYHSLSTMQDHLYEGKLHFTDTGKQLFLNADEPDFNSNMESVEKEFADYPSLIYDGPFSEHIHQFESKYLKTLPEVTVADAERIVREFLSEYQIVSVNQLEDGNGTISTYCFQVQTDEEDTQIHIAISKKGGYPVWMLNNKHVSSDGLSIEDAIEKAKQFLSEHHYFNMKESYYERMGNTLLINFAYCQNDVIAYPDLIKVKISLEDGKIMGFESNGYLMNHTTNRPMPETLLSSDEAYQIASNVMKVESQNLALIPLDTKKEVLCYEFKGKIDQDQYLIYLNAETGKQEEILLLLVSESGTLTI
ncbi:MAG: germination protein YpeB [Ruminococcaceae bacterium]|nr:germination protein YpeB [Oscillospiraceae bacterium]